MTSMAAPADEPAAITGRATGRQRGIELAVRGWPSTGNSDWPLTYFTLDGSDYPSHAAQEAAIAGYLRWRNRHCHCHPKRHFAVNSKIRRPDYLLNVA
jgi:hypothetical protein